jgi:hypothetical protein
MLALTGYSDSFLKDYSSLRDQKSVGSWLFQDVPPEVRTARDSQTSYFFNFDYALIAAMSGLPSH